MTQTQISSAPPRVLVTKIGLDGHDRGSRIVAAYLRDGGMEVIYTPPWQSIESVVRLAADEDVDVVGLSSLATDHLIVPQLMKAMRAANLGHVNVIIGGIIPADEHAVLQAAGVRGIFGPGSSREEIVSAVRTLALEARDRRNEALFNQP